MKQLTFREVQDYKSYMEEKRPDKYSNMSIGEFSQRMQKVDRKRDWGVGFDPSLSKKFGAAKDRFWEATGAQDLGEKVMGKVGEAIGYEDVGKQVGKNLASGIADTGVAGLGTSMLLAPEFVSSVVGAGLLGLSYFSGYGQSKQEGATGFQAFIDGALTAGTPAIGRGARQAATSFLKPRLGNIAKDKVTGETLKNALGKEIRLIDTVATRTAAKVGEEAFEEGVQFTADGIGHALKGGDPFDDEFVVANALGLVTNMADPARAKRFFGMHKDMGTNPFRSETERLQWLEVRAEIDRRNAQKLREETIGTESEVPAQLQLEDSGAPLALPDNGQPMGSTMDANTFQQLQAQSVNPLQGVEPRVKSVKMFGKGKQTQPNTTDTQLKVVKKYGAIDRDNVIQLPDGNVLYINEGYRPAQHIIGKLKNVTDSVERAKVYNEAIAPEAPLNSSKEDLLALADSQLVNEVDMTDLFYAVNKMKGGLTPEEQKMVRHMLVKEDTSSKAVDAGQLKKLYNQFVNEGSTSQEALYRAARHYQTQLKQRVEKDQAIQQKKQTAARSALDAVPAQVKQSDKFLDRYFDNAGIDDRTKAAYMDVAERVLMAYGGHDTHLGLVSKKSKEYVKSDANAAKGMAAFFTPRYENKNSRIDGEALPDNIAAAIFGETYVSAQTLRKVDKQWMSANNISADKMVSVLNARERLNTIAHELWHSKSRTIIRNALDDATDAEAFVQLNSFYNKILSTDKEDKVKFFKSIQRALLPEKMYKGLEAEVEHFANYFSNQKPSGKLLEYIKYVEKNGVVGLTRDQLAEYDNLVTTARLDEYFAGLNEAIVTGAVQKSSRKLGDKAAKDINEQFAFFMDDDTHNWIQGQAKDISNLAKGLVNFHDYLAVESGSFKDTDFIAGDSKKVFKESIDFLNDMRRSNKAIDKYRQDIDDLMTYLNEPGELDQEHILHRSKAFINMVDDNVSARPEMEFEDKVANKLSSMLKRDENTGLERYEQLGFFSKYFGNPSQLVKKYAETVPVLGDIFTFNANIPGEADRFFKSIASEFFKRDKNNIPVSLAGLSSKRLTPEENQVKTALEHVESNATARKVLSDALRKQNEEQKLLDSFETIEGWSDLDSVGQASVERMRDLIIAANKRAADEIIKTADYTNTVTIASAVMKMNPDMYWKDAFNKSLNLRKVIVGNESAGIPRLPMEFDENGVLTNIDQLTSLVNERLVKNGYPADPNIKPLVSLAAKVQPGIDKLINTLKNRPFFSSERRIGEYLIKYPVGRDDNDKVIYATEGAVDKDSLTIKRNRIMKEHGLSKDAVITYDKNQMQGQSFGMFDDDLLNTFIEIERAEYNALVENFDAEIAAELRQRYTPGDASAAELSKQKTKDYIKGQKLAPGREHLNMWESAFGYYDSVSRSLAYDRAKASNKLMFMDANLNDPANFELKQAFEQYADFITSPQKVEFANAKKGIFSYWLGFNFSSALIELTQPAITLAPQLTESLGIKGAMQNLKSTSKLLAKAYFGKKTKDGKDLFDFGDEEFNTLYQRAIEEGVVQYGSLMDVMSTEHNDFMNERRLKAGLKPKPLKNNVANVANKYFQLSKALYSTTSSLGAKAGFVSGLLSGREKGLKGKDLYEHALLQVRSTTYSGGVANQPLGFTKFKPGSRIGGVAQLAFTLNNFSFAAMHMYARQVGTAFGKLKEGGPSEMYNSLFKTKEGQAALQALGTQMFFAGAMGMPMAGALVKVMEEFFGVEIYNSMREGVASIAGDDEELGDLFATMALEGVPNLLPVDIQSRFGMGALPPFSEYNGFDINGMFGAGGSIIENSYDGLKELSRGNFGRAGERLAPQAFKKIIHLTRNEGSIHDMKGEKLMDPNATESMLYLLGFKPAELGEVRRLKNSLKQSDKYHTEGRKQDINEISEKLLSNDIVSARVLMERMATENPSEDIESIASAAALAAIKKQLPMDPGYGGTKANAERRHAITKSFGEPSNNVPETLRGDLRRRFKSQLTGRPEFPSARQRQKEQMIDNIRLQDPTIGVSKARAMVEQMLGL